MGTENFISLSHVSKTFPGVKALQDVSFDIHKGEIHALIGENGAGKSTLIKILSGVYQSDPGAEISILGKKYDHITPLEALKAGIVVIYQDFSFFPNLSVAENIAISRDLEKGKNIIDWDSMRRLSAAALERLGVSIDVNTPMGELSIAKQQLVAVARALVYDAKLIIMDEPTSSLSKGEVELLFRVMKTLRDSGISILFISHKLDELFAVSDRFTILRDGMYIGTFGDDDLDNDKLISLMVGRSIEYKVYDKRKTTEVLLKVEHLSKRGNFKDINFELHRGEILGITGLVGAGRTEVLQAIFGITDYDEGRIKLEGVELKHRSPEQAVHAGFGYIPENRLQEGLVLRKSIEDNIVVTVLDQVCGPLGLRRTDKMGALVSQWMDRLSIKPNLPEMPAANLSGGNQQRVVLAKWLAKQPKVLFVDEPTNGIDVKAKSEIHKILRDLAEEGMGIILVSSELPEILAIADRVIVMRHGKITAQFDGATVSQEDIMSKAVVSFKI